MKAVIEWGLRQSRRQEDKEGYEGPGTALDRWDT